ncbi:hypothetical protein SDC9_141209 [bioreactor metagenome]|uniref:Uncharacterized protein n=1 Tax=bioreactor metagenome TaxID=1076179 RepID=A0A645DXJ9_9ZZZZ
MKKILIASLFISIIFAGVCNNEALAQKAKKAVSQKPMQGKIVSLDDVIKGEKNLQLTKERAKELFDSGNPLVFLCNKKVYFVQGADGNFAFKKLANYAHYKTVGIVGVSKTISGINFIIMDTIDKID